MNKKILVFICCVVLVSKTIKSQVVSVEGVWHADTVQYAAPFSLGFWFVNTGTTPILDSFITANIVIAPVNAAPQNWQTLTFIQNIPQGIFAAGDSLFIYDLNSPLNVGTQLYQQLPTDCYETLKEVEPLREVPYNMKIQEDVYKTLQDFMKK